MCMDINAAPQHAIKMPIKKPGYCPPITKVGSQRDLVDNEADSVHRGNDINVVTTSGS